MKNELTISELAKLMGVSVHQIRYFEEKGVLHPAYIDDNQYRMYGMDQIYQLAHILLLRKLGVCVSAIKECVASYSAEQYRELLQQSLQGIQAELLRLTELQQFIQHVLLEQESFGAEAHPYQFRRRDTACLVQWLELEMETTLNARHLAEHARSVPDLFESDIHWVYDGTGTITLYMESDNSCDLTLQEGMYFTIQVLVSDDRELEQHIEQFYAAAAAQSINVTGPLLIVEKSYLSLFSNKQLCYELQMLI
ncbi:MerR family transcriptional regulator [Paenibacillus sp. NPDC057967]|uniref:MerR family transcriptional regulator n=1 Tax=Paenibacillus sp. NPDC057967 TaxID=3346293 RepID=UPI0036DBF86D